jgi:hypothetical protein
MFRGYYINELLTFFQVIASHVDCDETLLEEFINELRLLFGITWLCEQKWILSIPTANHEFHLEPQADQGTPPSRETHENRMQCVCKGNNLLHV